AAGTHTYTVTEVNGGETIDGITYDDSEITVTVNVVDNGDGTLTASVDANSPAIAFQNEYNVGKTSITLEGAKTLTGKTLTDNQFSFVVMEGTAKVAEGTNAADGTITFEAIEYTKAGTHTYVISEVNGGEIIDGITYDDSEITITVNVVDNGDGTLTASVDANSPAIAFQNEYNVGKTSITLKGTKALTGKTLTDNQFSFVVMEGTTKVSEGTNAADGTITFDEIEYTKAGTHTYVISEVNGGETIDGITYDADTITVTVNVVDNGDGTLTASVDATSPEIKFENEYNVGKTSITLKGTKTLTGKTLTDGAFTFTVYEGEDEVSEGTNAADGTITFEAIEYTKAGTHTYVISEVNGGETIDGITYDADTITVTVNVVDNGDGTLTASVDANSPAIAFQNEYNVGKTSITLEGTKTLTGKTLTGGAFTFTVYEGTTKVAEGTNAADGTITFDEIEYTAAGTHTYTITEVNGGETIDGITYDDSEITVTVNVVDNGDGILTASVDANSPAIAFVNTYAVSGEASITLNGTKILDGRAMVDGEFEFEVKEGDDVVARGTNNANGEILFETITYTAAGTHTYTVTEVKGTDKEITYDEASYTVVVNVTDNGDGTLTASFEGEAPVIEFANTYTYIDDNAYLTLKATKAYNKGTLKGDDFSFELKDESGNVLQTVTNDVQGNITFETITYTAQGTYLYTINEVIGSDSDIKYDKSVYTVTVNVTAQADGKLVADIAITVNETETEEIIFINTYDKPAPQTPIDGHIKINVKKQIVDETGDGYKLDGFVFILENLTTGQIYNATSDVNGDAVFDVGFTVAEVGNIYEYELTEADTRIEGMEYDTSAHRFNIKVTYIPPIAKVDAYIYRDGKTLTGVIATFVNTYKGIPKIDPPDEPDIDPVEPICFEEEDVIGC
ncbi:MAG: hypothetical protein IJ424_00325, partial [Oscillospiraceae bacterium]|nr:hypothetical protein [Oscillospiraceae bacterium]